MSWWDIWKYTIGSFDDETTREQDNIIAVIRTVIVLINVMCACMIMANIVHGW